MAAEVAAAAEEEEEEEALEEEVRTILYNWNAQFIESFTHFIDFVYSVTKTHSESRKIIHITYTYSISLFIN